MEFGQDKFVNPTGFNFSLQFRIFAGVILFGNLLRAASINTFGDIFFLLLTPLCLVVLLTRSRLEIDFVNKKYREARYLFGIFVYGGWQPFPAFEYVSVFVAQIRKGYNTIGAQISVVDDEIQVNLVYNKNRA